MKYLKLFESNDELYKEIDFIEYFYFIEEHDIIEDRLSLLPIANIVKTHISPRFSYSRYRDWLYEGDRNIAGKNFISLNMRDMTKYNGISVLYTSDIIHKYDYINTLKIVYTNDEWILINVISMGTNKHRSNPLYRRWFKCDGKEGLIEFLKDKIEVLK
jgi:hypothetical protein